MTRRNHIGWWRDPYFGISWLGWAGIFVAGAVLKAYDALTGLWSRSGRKS